MNEVAQAVFRGAMGLVGLPFGPALLYAELVGFQWTESRLPRSQTELSQSLCAEPAEFRQWIKHLESEGLIVVSRFRPGLGNRIVPVGPWSQHWLRGGRERGQG